MTRWQAWLRQQQIGQGPRIVAIGGGTGLSSLLRGLKEYTSNITAVVTVTDNGGSSGRLVGELGIPPPGDIRNVLVALAETEPLMERLFQYRFSKGTLKGHSLGNLFLGALTEMLGDFERAVHESSKVLAVRGRVLPSTNQPVQLCAEFSDGRHVCGETEIVSTAGKIRRVYLRPEDVKPPEAALKALAEADMIVMGPGSLYTSVLPNLLIPQLVAVVQRSPAIKVYVVNVMTQPGETDGYTAADHLRAILHHTGPGTVNYAVVNIGMPDVRRIAAYRAQGAELVKADLAAIRGLGVIPIPEDVIGRGDLVRHDPHRLANALLKLVMRAGRSRVLWQWFWRMRRRFSPAMVQGKDGEGQIIT